MFRTPTTPGCASGCEHCPSAAAEAVRAPLRGGRFACASALCFLAPLLLALAGAVALRESPGLQALATVAGLAASVAFTVPLVRWIAP